MNGSSEFVLTNFYVFSQWHSDCLTKEQMPAELLRMAALMTSPYYNCMMFCAAMSR